MIHWVGESDGEKNKYNNNLLLLALLPGGSASQATSQPLWPWWVRAPPTEQGFWGAPPHTGPSHPTAAAPRKMMGRDHLKQLQTAVNKLQTNPLREILIWCCWLYHLHLKVCNSLLLFNSAYTTLQQNSKMGEERGDENWRKGHCVTKKMRDFKAVMQLKHYYFFLCYSCCLFSHRCSRQYLPSKKYPAHTGEEYKLNYICVLLQEITEVMDPLVLISSNSSALSSSFRKVKPTQT